MDLNKWKHPILYPAAITVSEKKPADALVAWIQCYRSLKVLSGIEITEDSDVERVLKAALKNMAFL